jgi:chromosome segregation ATPase
MSERMSEERLIAIKHAYSVDVSSTEARQVVELLAEIDALRADLAAAQSEERLSINTKTEDIRALSNNQKLPPSELRAGLHEAADIIDALRADLAAAAAAKAEAERKIAALTEDRNMHRGAHTNALGRLSDAERRLEAARRALERATDALESIGTGGSSTAMRDIATRTLYEIEKLAEAQP